MTKMLLTLTLLAPVLISGCASPRYACGVPDGIGCKPLSEVHRMAKDGSLKMRAAPSNRDEPETKNATRARSDVEKLAGRETSDIQTESPSAQVIPQQPATEIVTVTPGTPILIPPKTMRVWVARWPDEDGTLHDETYLYLKLDNGHWVME